MLKKVVKLTASFLLAGILSCKNNLIMDNNHHFLNHQQKTTDSQGTVNIDNKKFVVHDVDNNPISNVRIDYLNSDNDYLALAVKESYYPEVKGGVNILSKSLKKQELFGEILLVLGTIENFRDVKKSSEVSQKTLLGKDEYFNKYCMTIEQMQNDYINIPAGFVSLAAGGEDGIEEEIKIGSSVILGNLFKDFIEAKYGRHDGYEVWSPKTAMSICGEGYDNLVCPITIEEMSKKIWQPEGVPIWKIVGSCNQKQESNKNFNLIDGPDKFSTTLVDTVNHLMWTRNTLRKDYNSALSSCNLDREGFSNWRIPNIRELEIYLLPEKIDSCYSPAIFNGCETGEIWSSEFSEERNFGNFYRTISFQTGIITEDPIEHTNGIKCVRNL